MVERNAVILRKNDLSDIRSVQCLVGAPQPRRTMHTKPLSPSAATLNPETVSIFTMACAETLAGAALFANDTSASGVIVYSLSGGYLELCPSTEAACRLVRSRTNPAIISRVV